MQGNRKIQEKYRGNTGKMLKNVKYVHKKY